MTTDPGPAKSGGVQELIRLRWGRVLFFACIVQAVVLLALLISRGRTQGSSGGVEAVQVKSPLDFPQSTGSTLPNDPEAEKALKFSTRTGPWGDLLYVRVRLEPPNQFVPASPRIAGETTWFFPGFSRKELDGLFEKCGLTESQRATLGKVTWTQEQDGISGVPGTELILSLGGEARLTIYNLLSRSPRNESQMWPSIVRKDAFEGWLKTSEFTKDQESWMRRLFYPRSDWLCFSDLPEMLSVSSTDAERRKLFKVLSGNETMLMKLLVHPRSDVRALVQYWSRGSRAKDIEPILESMSRLSTTNSIDVINFLPAFARKRLNTYPTPSTQKDRPNEDCFWTAFNFFNDPPGETVKDQNQWGAELNTRYQMVASPAFGDMVFVTTPQGDAVHAAVYIADNVVFTKNGGNLSQPWLLMTMQDMLAEYLQYFPLKISYFRLKQPAF